MPGSVPRFARLAVAVALLGSMATFLWVAAGVPHRDFTEERIALASGSEPAGPFTHSGQCQRCHAEIFAEWQADQHSTAWTEDKFAVFTNKYTQVECLGCHAPQPMLEVGVEADPRVRDEHREDGVGCVTCHVRNGHVYGTLGAGGQVGDCNGRLEPLLKTSMACYHCHHTHNLYKEYLASPQYAQGMTCQDCHMKEITRPLAEGFAPRRTRLHAMHAGGHDVEGLKTALQLDLAVVDGQVRVTVTNVGAAHGVPGEINNRVVRLEVSVRTPGEVEIGGRMEPVENEVAAWQAIFQAPPRLARDNIPSTQIMPGQPRVLTWDLPVAHGKIIATLSYKLESYMLNADAVEMTRKEQSF